MRRTILLLTGMAIVILLASGMAFAIIGGQPDGKLHSYVGMIYNDKVSCSGTLISPTVVLSAGHCTELFEQGDSQIYVTFEPEAAFNPSDAYAGTAHTHPDFCLGCAPGLPGFDRFDVGVIVLDRPVEKVRYGKLPEAGLVTFLDKGQLLTTVGYGVRDFQVGGGPPLPTDIATRYRATVRILNTNNVIGDTFVKHSGGSAGRGGEGTCSGDSGGPYFLRDQRTVVAITAFGNSLCTGPGYAQRVDLPRVLRFINQFL